MESFRVANRNTRRICGGAFGVFEDLSSPGFIFSEQSADVSGEKSNFVWQWSERTDDKNQQADLEHKDLEGYPRAGLD